MNTRALVAACVATVVGVLALVAGWILAPERTWFAYLTAWVFAITTAAGGLVLVMMAHATRSRWFAVVRRIAEMPASALPILLVLAVPLFFALDTLYDWARPLDGLPLEERHLLEHKRVWLNAPFFVVRTIFWAGIWAAAAWRLHDWSLRQDRGDGVSLQIRMQRFSSGALLVMAFTLTFASFDWVMSLQSSWQSTVFGIYVGSGALVAAFALLCVLAVALGREDALEGAIATAHRHTLGKLLFAMVIFWAYIAFVQLLLHWIANEPREVDFWIRRADHGWIAVGILLGLSHFAVPFLFLLPRETKRRPLPLAAVGIWLLFAHYVDVYWLVVPNLRLGAAPHWTDLGALLAIGGASTLFSLLRYRDVPLLARGDTSFAQALRYRGS